MADDTDGSCYEPDNNEKTSGEESPVIDTIVTQVQVLF